MYLVLKDKGKRDRWSIRLRSVKYLRVPFLGMRRVSSERYVNKRRVLIIVGGLGRGKTRELSKLLRWSGGLFGKEAIYIPVGEAVSNWYKRAGIDRDELKGLSQFEKNGKLIGKIKGKVVLLDDIDKAQSKVKTDLVKWLIRVSQVVVVSCGDMDKVNPSLVSELRKKAKLRDHQNWGDCVIELGKEETEIRDVGLIVGLVLIVGIAIACGMTEALAGALAFRWLVAEARFNK